jgi:hypothetical protein
MMYNIWESMGGTRAMNKPVEASAVEKDCLLMAQEKMYKRRKKCHVGFEVLTAMTLKRRVFGNVALCSQVEVC